MNRFNVTYKNYIASPIHVSSPVMDEIYAIIESESRKKNIFADIGCGTGHFSKRLMSLASEVHLVDPSESMLSRAKENLENGNDIAIKCHQSSSEFCLEVPRGTFDFVITRLALHHFEDVQLALKTMCSLLKPDGKMIITDLEEPSSKALSEINHKIEIAHDPSHQQCYNKELLIPILRELNCKTSLYKSNCLESTEGISISEWCKITNSKKEYEINRILGSLSDAQLEELGYYYFESEYRNRVKTYYIIVEKCQ